MARSPNRSTATSPQGAAIAATHRNSSNSPHISVAETYEEKLAKQAIIKIMPESNNIQVTGIVEQFLGGILFVMEYVDEEKDECEVMVFVNGGKSTIYWTSEDLAKFVAASNRPRRFVETISSSDFVIAILSFVIVISAFSAFFLFESNKDALSWVQAPMSIVLGFWFGRGYHQQETRRHDI